MRRVRNQRIHSGNPSLLFGRGIESIVSEQLQRRRYQDQDEEGSSRPAAVRQESRGNCLTLLMRQFANI
jgi:hypothetical protein